MDIEPTLPSPGFCALMAFERLKDDGNAEAALAWATLGTLVQSISPNVNKVELDLAVAVANAAAELAKNDTPRNKSALRKALVDWIDRGKKA